MCGILISTQLVNYEHSPDGNNFIDYKGLTHGLREAIAARGPDAQKNCKVQIEHNCSSEGVHVSHRLLNGLSVELFASELRLRGDFPVVQPHERDSDIFCWNGEIFEGLDVAPHENDGIKLFEAIIALPKVEQLPELFGSVEGPYAFVYYHRASEHIFFARDPLGRRSILIHKPTIQQPYFFLASASSVSNDRYEMEELPTTHIYCLDLQRLSDSHNPVAEFESCMRSLERASGPNVPFSLLCPVNRELPPDSLDQATSLDHGPDRFNLAVDGLIYHLDRSVMLQVQNIPHSSEKKGQARVAVLFSGGIDCTVLAFFANRYLPMDEPIDLLNVAFNNPRKLQAGISKKKKNGNSSEVATEEPVCAESRSYMVPDRLTGLQELEELRRLCPGRIWNFVEVDVPYEDSQKTRSIVESIMAPCNTVMDLSLAMALYFASKGVGQVRSSPDKPPEAYISAARVLLNGLGSDELLGGYGRHRIAYAQGGWQALIDELQLEIDRIPSRNLGRDDRIISSHGKETRHPFLSLSLVSFLAKLPVHLKVDPRLELGLGDKILLRLAARKVGLVEASQRKKKAMQFGSHSARMEVEGREKERRGDLLLVRSGRS